MRQQLPEQVAHRWMTVAEAMQALCLRESAFYERFRAGELGPTDRKYGRWRLVSRAHVDQYVSQFC